MSFIQGSTVDECREQPKLLKLEAWYSLGSFHSSSAHTKIDKPALSNTFTIGKLITNRNLILWMAEERVTQC